MVPSLGGSIVIFLFCYCVTTNVDSWPFPRLAVHGYCWGDLGHLRLGQDRTGVWESETSEWQHLVGLALVETSSCLSALRLLGELTLLRPSYVH